mmetsp:Transcript_25765/g.53689  ORF Transcript_25765/g.53689 Transcript_25765/m.53689 type:complete len:142 (+) Transcript_25765:412-837(+)
MKDYMPSTIINHQTRGYAQPSWCERHQLIQNARIDPTNNDKTIHDGIVSISCLLEKLAPLVHKKSSRSGESETSATMSRGRGEKVGSLDSVSSWAAMGGTPQASRTVRTVKVSTTEERARLVVVTAVSNKMVVLRQMVNGP